MNHIDFMVIAPPRCATTWIANWLTTDTTICYHDPLMHLHPTEIDEVLTRIPANCAKVVGIACTGIALFPDWVNAHPARKLILERPFEEIDASLERVGVPMVSPQWEGAMELIAGKAMPWDSVFDCDKATEIYRHLLRRIMDPDRWHQLREMYIAPNFNALALNRGNALRLMRELAEASLKI